MVEEPVGFQETSCCCCCNILHAFTFCVSSLVTNEPMNFYEAAEDGRKGGVLIELLYVSAGAAAARDLRRRTSPLRSRPRTPPRVDPRPM